MDDDLDWEGELPCPSFTMVPDVIFDRIMPKLAGGEWKVLGFLIRDTYGWHRRTTQVSLDDVCAGAGVSRRTAVDALKAFERKGLVAIHRKVTHFGKEQNTYELRIASDPKYTAPKSKHETKRRQTFAVEDGENVAVPSSSNTDTKTEKRRPTRQHTEPDYDSPEYRSGEAYRGGKYGHLVE